MKFSLFFFSGKDTGQCNKYQFLLDACELADELGFAAVWVPERHFDHFGGIFPSPSVAAAAIAVRTKRIEIRAGSVVLPLHHPVRVVEEWAMVDNLSNGRAGISFASGWHAQDFVLQPQHYAKRRDVLIHHMELFHRLWRGEKVNFPNDDQGGVRSIQTYPRPLQAHLPCWLTAAGHPDTFTLAGKLKMRLLTHLLNHTIDELKIKLNNYYKYSTFPYVTLMLHTFVGDSIEEAKFIVEKPLKEYLKTALDLERANQADAMELTSEEEETILDFSFNRYFSQSGLFGTAESCMQQVKLLKTLGVHELACLIDFGVDESLVLSNIKNIAYLSNIINQSN
jgi:natural product biosynthesis luciferase-like monooxygenase protein